MSLTPEEIKIVEFGKNSNKSKEQIIAALVAYQNEQKTKPKPSQASLGAKVKEFARETTQDISQATQDFGQAVQSGAENIQESRNAFNRGEQGFLRTVGQNLGSAAGAGAGAIGAVVTGVSKAALPEQAEVAISQGAQQAIEPVVSNPAVQNLLSRYEGLQKTNPALARDIEAALGVGSLATEFVGAGQTKRIAGPAVRAIGEGSNSLITTARNLPTNITKANQRATQTIQSSSPAVSGIMQTGQEMIERVPRFANRVRENILGAAERAEQLKSATPEVRAAIKSGLPDTITNTFVRADDATKRAYKEIVDIAEDSSDVIKPKERPEIIAGKIASEQYKKIDNRRREVGSKIGEATQKLSKDIKVDMNPAYKEMESVLETLNITPQRTASGVQLNFAQSGFSTSQRNKIKELYKLATEGGDTLTPKQLYDKDKLFSQLQREARMEGIGDVLIDVADSERPVSLFKVFRDVYSKKLDEVSPEDIRTLNKQYRDIYTLQEDIEKSIVKSGNFETTKATDPAEFAQTNLRRLFSNAQSAADYRAIAREMDQVARQLGYEGAAPDDVAAFAFEIQKIYPEAVPETGFSGGIRAGISDIAEQVLSAGQADVRDQQKALRRLVDSINAQ